MVTYVRIRNRKDCCGPRLAKTTVKIGGKFCGSVQEGTQNG